MSPTFGIWPWNIWQSVPQTPLCETFTKRALNHFEFRIIFYLREPLKVINFLGPSCGKLRNHDDYLFKYIFIYTGCLVKNTFFDLLTQWVINLLIYICIAFIFQIIIFRSFRMLFKNFLVIVLEGVFNIGTQALRPDELKWYFHDQWFLTSQTLSCAVFNVFGL